MKNSTKILIGVAILAIATPVIYTQLTQLSNGKIRRTNGMHKIKFDSSSNIDATTGKSVGAEDKYNKTTKLRKPREIIEETPEAVSVYATGFSDEGTMFWMPMPNFQFGPKVITSPGCGYGGKGWFGNGIAIEIGSKKEKVSTMDDGYYLYEIPYDENDEEGNPKLTLVFEPDISQPISGGGFVNCGWGGEADRRIKIPRALFNKWKEEVEALGKRISRRNKCEQEVKDLISSMTDIIENSGCEVGGFFGKDFRNEVNDFQATGILFGEMSYFCPNEKATDNLSNALVGQAGGEVRERVRTEKACQKR